MDSLKRSDKVVIGIIAILGLAGVLWALLGGPVGLGDFVLIIIAAVLGGIYTELVNYIRRRSAPDEQTQPTTTTTTTATPTTAPAPNPTPNRSTQSA
jgi:uncharacterized membrane protein YoaK (UPF0700 family)